MGDVWNVQQRPDGSLPTLLAHSTLDRETVASIASGHTRFPDYRSVPLTPERRLLHELIVQTVTERQLHGSAEAPSEALLASTVTKIVHSPAYRAMVAHGDMQASHVSGLLDAAGLQRLPEHAVGERTTMLMVTGGPASGKSILQAELALSHPAIYSTAAIVNSDDYKALLADPHVYGEGYASAAHAESALLSDEIVDRLAHKMDAGRAPNVVLDVVTLNDQRMALARKSPHLIVAAGAVPAEVALSRSQLRGEQTGRVVPSEAVLAGAKAAAATAPRLFEHPHLKLELFNTDVPIGSPHVLIAKSNDNTLVVRDPDAFLSFVEQQSIDPRAKSSAQLLPHNAGSPAAMAAGLKAYTDRGVTVAFLDPHEQLAISIGSDGVDMLRPLTSSRGASFFPELVAASRLVMETGGRRSTPEPHAEEGASHARGPAYAVGAAVALSGKAIYDDLAGPNSRLKHDAHAGGVQAAAGAARFGTQLADFAVGAAAMAESVHRVLDKAAPAAEAMVKAAEGPAMRLAGKMAIPLAIGAGVLEAAAGVAEHNARRVAAAVGNTGGGLAGGVGFGALAGAAWGGVGGSETGPGAVVTAGVGALGGAIVGGVAGEDKAKQYFTGAIDKAMHLFDHPTTANTAQPAASPPAHVALPPAMARALAAARHAGIAPSIQHDGHDGHVDHPAAPAVALTHAKAAHHR